MNDHLHKVGEITHRLESAFGEPRWKGRGNPLGSLILTVLSQSTNDNNRDVAYARLKERFPDWHSVMAAPANEIADVIRPAGLGNQKGQRIKEILRWIYATYGTFDLSFICDMAPQEVIETFIQLKGVGIKTISVVLMFTCGVDIFPVDTHVHRICRRLGLVPEKANAEKTFVLMQPLVPDGKSYSLHMNFLLLGRTVCKAQKPRCPECPIADLCPSAVLI
ncbi:endonuclease III [candidate division KSB1 bacterium]|nr:endonuclease III [candidate division KSB1 bacterium]RQW01574.1 MAG: endonuclease III [candidate division KSB1 bacterium]